MADFRGALRAMRQAPAFFSLVIGILALGIAASVSLFSLVDGVLLRPLPYRDVQRLVMLTTYATKPPHDSNGSVSYNDFLQFQVRTKSFADLAVTFRTGWSRVTLTGGSEPVILQGSFVSPNVFALFGRVPILGRTFTAEENRRAERVVVIGEALWARNFGSSPQAIGQDLEMGHVRWRIIGVMPADFQVPFLDTEVWAPLLSHPGWNETADVNPRERPFWDVMARLKPGISLATAQAEVNSIWSGLRAAAPEFHTNDIRVVPLREHFTGRVQRPISILFAAVALLLLIACANVANLLLARAAQRQRELAIRTALGAGHGRLLQQSVAEALTLCSIAGSVGVAAAVAFVPLLKALSPADIPLLNTVTLDGRGLLFASAVSLGLGLVLGILPFSRVAHNRLNESLNAAGRSATEGRRTRSLKALLVTGEFALAMVLLTGAGLLIRSFVEVLNVNLGFRPENVLTVRIGLPGATPEAQTLQIYTEIMQRISALPGVRAVGGVGSLFSLDETRSHALRLVEGHAPEPKSTWKPLVWTQVAGDYFQAMGIPLLRGRLFDTRDTPNSPPVAVVNETLARRYWPGQDPVGKHVKGFDPRGQHDDWLTIVGVVKDTRTGGLEKQPFSQIYELQAQRTSEHLGSLVVRTAGNPASLAASVRAVIHSVNRHAAVPAISSMELLLDQQKMQRRFQTWLIGVFSGLALALAALGVFATMHYSVAARTREIGIRVAVGATAADIARLVLGSGTRMAFTGIAAGAFAAMWSTNLIAGMLYKVRPGDPFTFAAAALVLLVVALLASFLPAHRASRVDPIAALRQE
ncbi:MAG: ABC transporter permease [Acidobacteriaceae bacterium]|nr:ABC transporter permease [Acidobacteriaceae bacterium]